MHLSAQDSLLYLSLIHISGRKQFAGEIDLYPSSPFFIEAVPLGVAKDVSLGSLLESRGLTRDNRCV